MGRYMQNGDCLQAHHGFTYLGMLFVLAITGISLAMTGTLWSFTQTREKEVQLLFVGNQFRQAIGNYYERSPGVVKRYPHSLEELLKDNRYVTIQRHLRRIYIDPITMQADWGLVSAPDGGVMGVYSKSDLMTIKRSNFQLKDLLLEGRQKYSDWKFIYEPRSQAQK